MTNYIICAAFCIAAVLLDLVCLRLSDKSAPTPQIALAVNLALHTAAPAVFIFRDLSFAELALFYIISLAAWLSVKAPSVKSIATESEKELFTPKEGSKGETNNPTLVASPKVSKGRPESPLVAPQSETPNEKIKEYQTQSKGGKN